MIELRPHQADLIGRVRSAWETDRNILMQLPTGGGKTVILARIIHETRGAVCAIAHRRELVAQISLALAREGVRHRIIGARESIHFAARQQVEELGRSYYDAASPVAVASVDTLVARERDLRGWAASVTLWVQDECHHVLRGNKWGAAAAMFPNARGLGVTATPERSDGRGLGAHADGVFHARVCGPGVADLTAQGYLSPYRVFCPSSNVDMSGVSVSRATGDYSLPQMRARVRESQIVGDVVEQYRRIAPGKLGITFVPDVGLAAEVAERYNAAGIPAASVNAATPDAERADAIRRFRRRELLQLVNVDLFGEGFDLPAIEVVSFARPTASYGLYCLDPETEVLTPAGWARSDEALRATQVIAFDPASEKCRPAEVTGRVRRPLLNGERMFGVASPHLDIAVSDRHRMLVRGHSRTCRAWQFQTAEEAARRKSLWTLPVAADGDYAGAGLTASELRFIGWFQSDGSINPTTGALAISQAEGKTAHIESIRAAIEGCGFKYSQRVVLRKNAPASHQGLVVFTVSRGAPRGRDKHLSGWARLGAWLDKSLPECFDSLTRCELVTMLETWNLGDGLNNHSSLDYVMRSMRITCGDNRRMADRLQALCVTRGLRCNMATQRVTGRREWYTLYLKDVRTSTLAGTNDLDGSIAGKRYSRSRLGAIDARPEFVWCLTNDLGTLITRRNGKVAIVGNCQQFGRGLRPMPGKQHAIIIDHVGNVMQHGLPDAPRRWSLDARERRAPRDPNVIPLRSCPECFLAYESHRTACPYCGHSPERRERSRPAEVEGDLYELTGEALERLRQAADATAADTPPDLERLRHSGAPQAAVHGYIKQHRLRREAQLQLRETMARWAGVQRDAGLSERERHRRFFHAFGIDALSAQGLGRPEAEALKQKIEGVLNGA